jgi:hypothetical protein
MPADHGEMVLSGNFSGVPAAVAPGSCEAACRAREAVAARRPGLDQDGLCRDAPRELDGHIGRLRQSPAADAMLSAGWHIAVVDLARVCAFQPIVLTDTAPERVGGLAADDVTAVAAVTLPTAPAECPHVGFDPAKQAFTVLSPNRNLRVVGQIRTPLPDSEGALGLGFVVRVMPSFVQVIRFQGRYLLHDGYHRAFGLLGRGIRYVPAFMRDVAAIEEFAVPGMLPQSAFLGDRPPVLPDYHDDEVASSVRAPAPQKVIVIQGVELDILG